jgi:hypothetical protein
VLLVLELDCSCDDAPTSLFPPARLLLLTSDLADADVEDPLISDPLDASSDAVFLEDEGFGWLRVFFAFFP